MNTNILGNYSKAIVFAVVIALLAITIAISTYAQSTSTFLQTSGQISAVNVSAKSVTISYAQMLPMIACVNSDPVREPCPIQSKGRSPDTIVQDQVLVMSAFGGVIGDITMLKVGSNVTVYLKQNAVYAIKDTGSVTKVCDPSIQDSCGQQPPVSTGTIPSKCDPSIQDSCGQQPPATQCVQLQTYPPRTICPAVISNDLSVGTQSGGVITLQEKLQSLGYFPSTSQPTGFFGAVTRQAVIQYQAANGLPQTGYVGSMTRASLGY